MSAIEFRKILCPIDFTGPSEFGATCALDLAERLGGELHIVHVFEQPGMEGSKLRNVKRREAEAAMKTFVDQRLAELRVMAEAPTAKVSTEVLPGEAGEAVVEVVRERGFDVVVVATRGLTGLTRIINGSFAEFLIQHCSCPVLVVRHSVPA